MLVLLRFKYSSVQAYSDLARSHNHVPEPEGGADGWKPGKLHAAGLRTKGLGPGAYLCGPRGVSGIVRGRNLGKKPGKQQNQVTS